MDGFIQQVTAWKNEGKTPEQVMQILFQQNPKLEQTALQLKNMANGRNPQEFVMQLAQQNGVSKENLQAISRLFGR